MTEVIEYSMHDETYGKGGWCMLGNIYTRQKCWICNGALVNDERRQGCFCEKHPKVQSDSQFYVKFGRKINRRYPTYEQAYRFLIGLRYEMDSDKFDVRDYQASNPLGFSKLADQYLKYKKLQNLKSFYHIEQYINDAVAHFGDVNVKHVTRKQLRDYLFGKELSGMNKTQQDLAGKMRKISDKTRANHATYIKDFYYNFIHKEEELLALHELPQIPEIDFELGFRKIVDLGTREKIVDQIKKKIYHRQPKAWLAIDVLCAYQQLRPGDLGRIREGDIDLENGVITIWRPTKTKKNKDPKVLRIRMLPYHIDEFGWIKKEWPATDEVPFFRHATNLRGVPANEPYGQKFLYKLWKKACEDLGVVGLDLYGGTRHSGVTAIAKVAGKKKAKKASGHGTDKAFDRYCQIGDDDTFDMAQLMAKMRGKVVDLEAAKKRKKR